MSDDQYPKPDAAAAAAIAKAKKLMALTLGLTFIALAVVLAIIGYRLFNAGDASMQPPSTRAAPK